LPVEFKDKMSPIEINSLAKGNPKPPITQEPSRNKIISSAPGKLTGKSYCLPTSAGGASSRPLLGAQIMRNNFICMFYLIFHATLITKLNWQLSFMRGATRGAKGK